MKGKGKGKDQSDNKDCPLQFPDFTPIDHTRFCARYTTALQRSEEESIGIEDLDVLQLELEALLVSVTRRRDQLEDEMQILVTWQEKKEKKPAGKVEPESSGKRSHSPDGKPTKKYKDGSGKAHPVNNMGRPKSKNVQQTRLQEFESTDSPMEAPKVQRNDAPNRFWQSIEPYCMEITQDHIKLIEEWIKSHDDDSEYQKIPPLGRHFTYKWSNKDIQEEQKEGNKTNERRRGLSNNSSLNSVDGDKILKKVEKEYDSDDSSPLGALTQRLVTCLIEENLMTSLEDNIVDNAKDNTDDNTTHTTNKGNFMKSLNIGNAAILEKRIRKELEEQGILDADDLEIENPEDEVLTEIKRIQASLKPLSVHNLNQKKKLLKLAKNELGKQEIRKKLRVVDAEIMDIQRKLAISKQKKKSPTKKERDQALKALKERENLTKQLQI